MNLIWLDDFLTLASSGSFSRAAQERHMTQPAFSRRIRALEEWLGTELFDRSSQALDGTSGVRLADDGSGRSGARVVATILDRGGPCVGSFGRGRAR